MTHRKGGNKPNFATSYSFSLGLSGDQLKAKKALHFIYSHSLHHRKSRIRAKNRSFFFFFHHCLFPSWSDNPQSHHNWLLWKWRKAQREDYGFRCGNSNGHRWAPKIQFGSEEPHCREALKDSPWFICLIYVLSPALQQQSGRLELKKSHVNKWGGG